MADINKDRSRRAREQPKTLFSLHETTNATKSIGSEADIKANAKRLRLPLLGKKDIWRPNVSVDKQQLQRFFPSISPDACPATSASEYKPTNSTKPSPKEEHGRMVQTWKLRKKFKTLCATKGGGTAVPILSMERWLCRARLLEPVDGDDPLLPPARWLDEGLQRDLERAGVSKEDAIVLVKELTLAAVDAAKQIHLSPVDVTTTPDLVDGGDVDNNNNNKNKSKCKAMSGSSGSSDALDARVNVDSHTHSLDLTLVGEGVPDKNSQDLIKLSHLHLEKLRILYQRNSNNNNNNNNNNNKNDDDVSTKKKDDVFMSKKAKKQLAKARAKEASNAPDDPKFNDALFCLLARYRSLSGHGFQAAVNEHTFRILHSRLGVNFECFASPLNCHFGNFCSAFPDTDRAFGSFGSFFDSQPGIHGSFQANPPFISDVMTTMSTHIHLLLDTAAAAGEAGQDTASAALSFVVFVPGWTDEPSWKQMAKSPYLRAHFLVAKDDHGYVDGAQQQRQDRFRESPFDTAVFILQTDAAALKWPMSDLVQEELSASMALAIPTEQVKQRRLKQGRGHADADGGGGVYRGRRANASGEGVQKRRREEMKEKFNEKKKGRWGKKKKVGGKESNNQDNNKQFKKKKV